MDVTIVPEEGQLHAVAKMLIKLAAHPSQVRTVSHPAAGFEVPEDLFNKFEAAYNPAASDKTSDVQQLSTVDPQIVDNVEAVKRRGRPRKTPKQGQEE